MLWITPICDRTAADVAAKTAKGYLNAADLNRIESNCAYLADLLRQYGYGVTITTKTNWSLTDIPHRGQIDRVRANVETLRAAYYTMEGSPVIRHWESLDWVDVNSLEQNLNNINTMIRSMIDGTKYAGIEYSGV